MNEYVEKSEAGEESVVSKVEIISKQSVEQAAKDVNDFVSFESKKSTDKRVEGENESENEELNNPTEEANQKIEKLKEDTEKLLNQLEKDDNINISEKIREQISQMTKNNIDAQKTREEISDKIKKLIESKGYGPKISELENKIIRSENSFGENLIPNKEVGLSNLNKIMTKIDSQMDGPRKDRLKRELTGMINEISSIDDGNLYQYVQRMIKSTNVFKDMISKEDFRSLFSAASSSDSYISELIQERNKTEDRAESDPEINELRDQNVQASKVIEENSSYKIESKQKELNDLESSQKTKIPEFSNVENKETNETNYMTKKYSSTSEGLNGLAGLYNDYPELKGNKMFNESAPYLGIQTQNNEKFIIQLRSDDTFYIQGGEDGSNMENIKSLAEKMGRDVESLRSELKENLSK